MSHVTWKSQSDGPDSFEARRWKHFVSKLKSTSVKSHLVVWSGSSRLFSFFVDDRYAYDGYCLMLNYQWPLSSCHRTISSYHYTISSYHYTISPVIKPSTAFIFHTILPQWDTSHNEFSTVWWILFSYKAFEDTSSFSHSNYNFNNINLNKHRWCAWDTNPGRQVGRLRRNHRATYGSTRYVVVKSNLHLFLSFW